jgi:hypothetical protein
MSDTMEGPDEQITLQRACQLAGLRPQTLRKAAMDGRLEASRPARDWFTTRRKLHRYLAARSRGVIAPLPADYQTPEGEEPIA